jgi:hypothetical protein
MSGSAPLDGLSAHARPAPLAHLLIDCEEDLTLRAGSSACCGRTRGDRDKGIAMRTAAATFGLAWAGAVTVTAGFAPARSRRQGGQAGPQVVPLRGTEKET